MEHQHSDLASRNPPTHTHTQLQRVGVKRFDQVRMERLETLQCLADMHVRPPGSARLGVVGYEHESKPKDQDITCPSLAAGRRAGGRTDRQTDVFRL